MSEAIARHEMIAACAEPMAPGWGGEVIQQALHQLRPTGTVVIDPIDCLGEDGKVRATCGSGEQALFLLLP